jgi:hypothetical protein
MMHIPRNLFALGLWALAACGSSDGGSAPSGGGGDLGGSSGGQGGGGLGSFAGAGGSEQNSGGGTVCDIELLTPQAIYPEVLVVQDISGSMAGARWTATKAALGEVAMNLEARLRLGLYLYPETGTIDDSSCVLESFAAGQYVQVAPALNNGQALIGALATLAPVGGTPTPEALLVAHDYLMPRRPRRSSRSRALRWTASRPTSSATRFEPTSKTP